MSPNEMNPQLAIDGGPKAFAARTGRPRPKIGAAEFLAVAERFGFTGEALERIRAAVSDDDLIGDGPNLARSYVPGPALPRPWPTGDLGTWADGRLQVTGRVDDRVPVKGVNRALSEYEAEALRRPGVVEAVAVPVPDDVDGYRVVVFVEDDEHRLPRLRSGKPDRQELRRRALGQRR